MTDQNKVSGKIINYNSSYVGDVYFSEKINELKINNSDASELFIFNSLIFSLKYTSPT